MSWSFACPDWADRLKDGRSLVPDLPLDPLEAERAVRVFDKLRLPDVPGQPAMADAAGDWFRDIVRAVFGSLDASSERHVPELFALVPKKNSKTTGGAGIMLTALLLNQRPRAEFLLTAPTQDIADLAFQQASGMIEADPDGYLQKRFQMQEHLKVIRCRLTKAHLKIKTFDMKVMTGAKPAGVLVDELHIMSAYSHASRVIGQIRGGLLPNPEGFLIFITTQSDEPPAGVFRAELQYARGVRDGRIEDGRMLPILYEFPEEVQRSGAWREPGNWPQVLPNLGRSVTLERLIADYRSAKEKGEEEERRWASQHLNVEIGMALHSERWRGADHWLAAEEPGLTLEAILARSKVVTVGIDGGGLDDLLGLAVIGRCRSTGQWLVWGHAWCQPEVLDLRKDIAERLRDFERDGDLTIWTVPRQAWVEVADIVERIEKAGLLPEKAGIGVDTAGISQVLQELAFRGIIQPQVAGVYQGYRLQGTVLSTELMLKDKDMRHCGQGLMAWVVGNAKAKMKGSAVVIEKETAGRAKIDPLMALFDAADLMGRSPVAKGVSVYEERGLLVV